MNRKTPQASSPYRASPNQYPVQVTTLPGPRVLPSLVIVAALLTGILYAAHVGTDDGIGRLLGVSFASLVVLVFGVAWRVNRVAVELDEHHVIMTPSPLPLGLARRVRRADIVSLEVEVTGSDKTGRPKCALTMLHASKGAKRIADFDTDCDLAKNARESLTEALGL